MSAMCLMKELESQVVPVTICLYSCCGCRVQRHPFERIATPFQVYSWTAPQMDHAMDCVRAEDAYTSRLGYEEHIPGQVRRA